MLRILATVALATAFLALCPQTTLADTEIRLDEPPARQDVEELDRLIQDLERWLDANSPWQRRAGAPTIRIVGPGVAATRHRGETGFQRGRLRGLYDPDLQEILLVRPWDSRKPEDVSVLLHELTHHRQAPHHWVCPAAQELPAYRLQEAWLAEHDLVAEVNWIAVVLDAGCRRRDVHPD